jgi:hypothetical protein
VMIGEALRGPAAAIIPWITLCALFAASRPTTSTRPSPRPPPRPSADPGGRRR